MKIRSPRTNTSIKGFSHGSANTINSSLKRKCGTSMPNVYLISSNLQDKHSLVVPRCHILLCAQVCLAGNAHAIVCVCAPLTAKMYEIRPAESDEGSLYYTGRPFQATLYVDSNYQQLMEQFPATVRAAGWLQQHQRGLLRLCLLQRSCWEQT